LTSSKSAVQSSIGRVEGVAPDWRARWKLSRSARADPPVLEGAGGVVARSGMWDKEECGTAGRSALEKGETMSVAKIIEISAESPDGFEAAIREGIKRAGKTVKNIKGAWVGDQLVEVENDKIVNYRVHLKVTFVLD
jgi:flavin-binding protein dodecin